MRDVIVVIGLGQIGQAIARRVGVGKHVVLAERNVAGRSSSFLSRSNSLPGRKKTGGAVRPFTLCLSAQGSRWTDPTIAPALDGLKYFRLSLGGREPAAPRIFSGSLSYLRRRRQKRLL
jgi:hypothetical protein